MGKVSFKKYFIILFLFLFLISLSCIIPDNFIKENNLEYDTYYGFFYFNGIKNINTKIPFELVFQDQLTKEKIKWSFNLIGKKEFYYFHIKPGMYTLSYKFKDVSRSFGDHTIKITKGFLNMDSIVLYSEISDSYLYVKSKFVEREDFKKIVDFEEQFKPFFTKGIIMVESDLNLNNIFILNSKISIKFKFDDSLGYFVFNNKRIFNKSTLVVPFATETVFPFQIKGKFVLNNEFRLRNKLHFREIPIFINLYGKYIGQLMINGYLSSEIEANLTLLNKEFIINYCNNNIENYDEMAQTFYYVAGKRLLPYLNFKFYYK